MKEVDKIPTPGICHNIDMKRYYLASDSPRRKELLKKALKSRFSVCGHVHAEKDRKGLTPEGLALFHAASKAISASKKIKTGIVIGADTIVICGREILGKPDTKENARKMLRSISGKILDVITGLAVIEKPSNKMTKTFELTKVKIKKLSKREIEDYVRTKEPLDKAGAFGIQGKGGAIVEWIEGDYYNVVGLPVNLLKRMLGKFR
ncbi:MAG: Maf family protein [Candidatus Saganbacteria bacterium]|nr:Maf family protein [Candidatus Saganbacteria bacterium]